MPTKSLPSNTELILETKVLDDITAPTGNLYESLVIIGKRANQISLSLKEELQGKLQEFTPVSDNLEEVSENREQIEISRYYEKLPHPTLLATEEFLNDEVYFRKPEVEGSESE